MLSSSAVEERRPWRMEDCQTMRRSHCCVMRMSAFWMSVMETSESGGRLSCRWRVVYVSVDAGAPLDSFQESTKEESRRW